MFTTETEGHRWDGGSLAGAWGGLGSYVGDIQVGGYCGEDRRQINCRGKTISDDERKYQRYVEFGGWNRKYRMVYN